MVDDTKGNADVIHQVTSHLTPSSNTSALPGAYTTNDLHDIAITTPPECSFVIMTGHAKLTVGGVVLDSTSQQLIANGTNTDAYDELSTAGEVFLVFGTFTFAAQTWFATGPAVSATDSHAVTVQGSGEYQSREGISVPRAPFGRDGAGDSTVLRLPHLARSNYGVRPSLCTLALWARPGAGSFSHSWV